VTTTKLKQPRASDPAMLELHRLLLQSEKFLNWKPEEEPEKPFTLDDLEQSQITQERHYTPDELSGLWGVSAETVRNVFREEPGVLRLQQPTKGKRQYVLLRIPESVAERVHRRLSAVPA
jgi:hypothetical protein